MEKNLKDKAIDIKGKSDILTIIKTKFQKNGWSLIRTTKQKPFGFIGYMLTIYNTKDDITVIHDIKGKTMKSIISQLNKI